MAEKRVHLGLVEPMELSQFGVEPGDRLEPLLLERIIHGLSEKGVLQLCRGGTGRQRG
ncbi:MAG: hypothetical protein ABFS18_05980 [Thermodesulfobacteriota bacterium]